jgi:hypothetical protein
MEHRGRGKRHRGSEKKEREEEGEEHRDVGEAKVIDHFFLSKEKGEKANDNGVANGVAALASDARALRDSMAEGGPLLVDRVQAR